MEFYVPSSLQTDFSDMLTTFGTSVVINSTSATPTSAIVQLSRKSTQNTFQNLNDNSRTLRYSLQDIIVKGDYLTSSDHTYLVTWNPFRDINSCKSQCQICNNTLNLEIWQDAILNNSTGETATPAQYIPVVSNVVCFTSRTTTGIFDNSVNEVGIIPQGQMIIVAQYNENTSEVQIGNELNYRNIQYEIIDVDLSMLNDNIETGLVVWYVRKRAGGRRV